jgi:hypothetical protein
MKSVEIVRPLRMERNEWEGEKEVRVSLCKGGKAIRLCDETVREEQREI